MAEGTENGHESVFPERPFLPKQPARPIALGRIELDKVLARVVDVRPLLMSLSHRAPLRRPASSWVCGTRVHKHGAPTELRRSLLKFHI